VWLGRWVLVDRRVDDPSNHIGRIEEAAPRDCWWNFEEKTSLDSRLREGKAYMGETPARTHPFNSLSFALGFESIGLGERVKCC
jgi:hypothetical protein